MTIKQVVHYIAHHCGPQECDCLPLCKGRASDPMATSAEQYVTCKTCLRTLAARWAKIEADKIAYKAELYDEVWTLARRLGFANVTDAVMAAATRSEDIPDFTRGYGNRSRRRAQALGIDYDARMRNVSGVVMLPGTRAEHPGANSPEPIFRVRCDFWNGHHRVTSKPANDPTRAPS